MKKIPLILAHRGLVTEYQENTLAAVEAAIDSQYCNGTEFDVFLTKDNKVVLFHDENLKRLTGIIIWITYAHYGIQFILVNLICYRS